MQRRPQWGLQPLPQVCGNPLGSMPVPQLWNTAAFASACQYFVNVANNCIPISAHQRVGSLFNRDGPLGILTQGQAGHAQCGCSPAKARRNAPIDVSII